MAKLALAATQQERLMCLNTGGYSVDVPMRRFVLECEEKMLLSDLEPAAMPDICGSHAIATNGAMLAGSMLLRPFSPPQGNVRGYFDRSVW